MIYIYDKALQKDLEESFNPEHVPNPVVRVIGVEDFIGVAAQIMNDAISFPIVAINRPDSWEIDRDVSNFTRIHRGITTVINDKTNEIYDEQQIPVKISYDLHILTTNQADMDEMIRELIFKYTNMYYLTVKLPYEVDRRIRFGLVISGDIQKTSSQSEYIQSGQLYESVITLDTQGCMLVNYKPRSLIRFENEVEIVK